jgi:D-amino-acid dehydrogenase
MSSHGAGAPGCGADGGKSVVIIGGGVIGLCSAYYAARAGHRVTVIDRGGPCRDCCSMGNAGLVVPSHFVPLAAPGMVGMAMRMMLDPASPFYVRPRLSADLLEWGWLFIRAATAERVERAGPLLRDLNLVTRRCFEELDEALAADFDFARNGLLMLCRTDDALVEEQRTAARAHALGMPAEVLDAKQTANLEPSVRMDVVGSVYFPLDCHLSPAKFMAALQDDLERSGVRFEWQTEVTGWRTNGTKAVAVRTSRGEVTADEFVLAGGSWSPQVARGIGLRLRMQPGKGYSLTLDRPRRLPRVPAILVEARVAVTPMGGSLRFGGTMELAGIDHEVSPARVRGIVESACRYLPDFTPGDFAGVPAWHGLRPCSPDGLPYIGRTRRCDNVIVATGHAMMGLSLGPVTGRLVGEILSDRPPSLNIDLLEPDRHA